MGLFTGLFLDRERGHSKVLPSPNHSSCFSVCSHWQSNLLNCWNLSYHMLGFPSPWQMKMYYEGWYSMQDWECLGNAVGWYSRYIIVTVLWCTHVKIWIIAPWVHTKASLVHKGTFVHTYVIGTFGSRVLNEHHPPQLCSAQHLSTWCTVGKSGLPTSGSLFFFFVQTFFRAQMVISLRGLYKLRQRSVPCVGRTAVFCGHRGTLRLRGASVPFWLLAVWWRWRWREGVSGLSVAGRLEGGKGTCGHSYMSTGFTHICTHILLHISLLDPGTLLFL